MQNNYTKIIFKLLLPALALIFLLYNIAVDWDQLSSQILFIHPGYLFLSFSIMLFVYPEAAFTWYLLIRSMGIKISLLAAMRVWIIANTSRYIPGTIWQYIGRTELMKQYGVKRSTVGLSILMEIIITLLASGIVGAFTVSRFMVLDQYWPLLLIVMLGAAALVLVLFASTRLRSAICLLIYQKTHARVDQLNLKINTLQYISLLPLFIGNFLLNGLAIHSLIASFGVFLPIESVYTIASFYALAWAAGFLSLLSPGGIGVTEVIMAYMLSSLIPVSLASIIVITYRFALTIAELLSFIVAFYSGKIHKS